MTATTYECLDSGRGRKLERLGALVVDRPCPQADWAPRAPATTWQAADAVFERPREGESRWTFRHGEPPADWRVAFDDVTLLLNPAAHGQVGVFPEQLDNWRWLRDTIAAAGRPVSVLNGFAYTGAATLFAAAAGAGVCHVDAARSAVGRARENAAASGLAERPVRWIVDDMLSFMEKEIRRRRRYDGLILDPPAFGRGRGARTWSLARQLPELLELAAALLSDRPLFCLLTCHDPALDEPLLAQHLRRSAPGARVETGPLRLTAASGAHVPAGIFARWRRP